MHLRRGCWLANTHYPEGFDTLRIYCCELLNGRWQKRVGSGSRFRPRENHPVPHAFCYESPGKGVLAGASVRLSALGGHREPQHPE
jgi:hypothetical protein